MDTWPPPSLKVNAEAIANECEQAEVTPYHRPMLAVSSSIPVEKEQDQCILIYRLPGIVSASFSFRFPLQTLNLTPVNQNPAYSHGSLAVLK
jgi:hypothetical protein